MTNKAMKAAINLPIDIPTSCDTSTVLHEMMVKSMGTIGVAYTSVFCNYSINISKPGILSRKFCTLKILFLLSIVVS